MSDEELSLESSDDDTDTEQTQFWRAERLHREEFIAVCEVIIIMLHTIL